MSAITLLAVFDASAQEVTFSPTSLSFGDEAVKTTSSAKTVRLKNTGAATLDISSIAPSADFAVSSTSCRATLAVGKTCEVEVTFTPAGLGSVNGTLSFTDNARGSPQTVSLSGTGEAQATLTPSSHTFHKTKVGDSSAAHKFTLKNNLPTNLTGISYSTTGPFAVSTTTCGTTLNSKDSCTISVTFSPTETGAATGTLDVSDGANNSPQTVSLSGTGGAPSSGSTSSVVQNIMCANGGGTSAGTSAANSSYPYICGMSPTKGSNTIIAWAWGRLSTGTLGGMTVTDQEGDSFALSLDAYDTTNNVGLWVYCASGIRAGSTWFKMYPTTTSTTWDDPQAGIVEVQNGSCNIDQSNDTMNGSGSSMTPGSVTTTVNGDFIFNIAANGHAFEFSSIGNTAGWHGLTTDLWNGVASGVADQYEVQSTAGVSNPTMTEGASDGAWEDMQVAFKPSASGAAPAAFSILSMFHFNDYVASSQPSSASYQFPVHGNLVVISMDNLSLPTSVSDNNSGSWSQIGSNCANSEFGIAMWYRTVSSPPLENETITLSGMPSTFTSGLNAVTYDIQGASTSSPYDTGIGTSGFECAEGDLGSYVSPLTYFTFAPTNGNEIIIVHGNQDYNDAIGSASPSGSIFLSTLFDSGPPGTGGGFNYPLDESSYNAICISCSGSLTWEVSFDEQFNNEIGHWAAGGAAFNP